MVNPYSNATVKKKGLDGVEYDVPAPRTFNSVLAGLAVSRAIQDGDLEAISKGPLSTRAAAQRAVQESGDYQNPTISSPAQSTGTRAESGAFSGAERPDNEGLKRALLLTDGQSDTQSLGAQQQRLGATTEAEDDSLLRKPSSLKNTSAVLLR